MHLNDFLGSWGLKADPFAHTNAEEEELLSSYFVPPPYFPAVLGNPQQPKSSIVFAPRGGGKTAQRRMLEENSREAGSEYMCVLYDRFNVAGVGANPIPTEHHLNEICLRVLIGILVDMDHEGLKGPVLTSEDRDFLSNEAAFLDAIDSESFASLVNSLKSESRRIGDWLREHSGPVKGVVASILAKRGIELDPTLPWGPQMVKAKQASPQARLRRLLEVCQYLGFSSVYVLIDRLDETSATNTNPKRAIELVSDMLLELTVMEMSGLAIKVFAWDQSQDHYHELGGRPDRIREFTLEWQPPLLASMMSRRLEAYSDDRVNSLNDFLERSSDIDLHTLASHLAHGSPRDMIRLSGHIVGEHLDVDEEVAYISDAAVWRGVRAFSDDVCRERARKFLPDLMRLESYRFTQSQVANDYLKVSKQATQAKVTEWRRTAMIDKVTEVQDSRRRPQHLYGVADPRLAIHLRPSYSPREVLEFFSFRCDKCSTNNFSDGSSFICGGCQEELFSNATPSLMSLCTLNDEGESTS